MIAALLERLPGWLVASLRVAPALWAVPWWSGRSMHPSLRVAVSCVLALGVLPGCAAVTLPTGPWLLVVALRELTLGVVLALVLAAPFVALRQAGALLDATRGAGDGDGALAGLLEPLGAAVFLGSGAHRGVLRALAATWVLSPPADPGAPWPWSVWVERAARATAEALLATTSIASGALLATLACELALGVTGRLVPWRDGDGVARPVRALAPLVALALTLAMATDVARGAMQSALEAARRAG